MTEPAGTRVRLVEPADAGPLASLLTSNRKEFTRWEPIRPADYFESEGQERRIAKILAAHDRGENWPGIIVDGTGSLLGEITISNVMRGPFDRAFLGYWVSADQHGKGHATRAVHQILMIARDELGLKNLEAHTQVANLASQRVLRANGFSPFGVSTRHIYIDGQWRDDIFWEVALDSQAPASQLQYGAVDASEEIDAES